MNLCKNAQNIPLYGEIFSSSLALQANSKKSSIRSREMRDWLNTNLKTNTETHLAMTLQTDKGYACTQYKHTYTLSSTSSAMRRISKSSIIFPECSRISASASVTNSLCQSAVGLPGAEPEGRAVHNTELQISLHASDNNKPVTDTEFPKLRPTITWLSIVLQQLSVWKLFFLFSFNMSVNSTKHLIRGYY